jgi:CRISPR/Cas system-associated exonuclease Cas4 (RecB family)
MTNNFKTIDEAICEYMDKRGRRTTTERGNNYWSASSLGRCKRYQILCRAGIITNGVTNYAWKNAAEDGHMGHAWRQHALQNVGVLIDMEQPIIDEELKFRGHFDLIVNLSGKLVLGDIKTQNSRAFKFRSRLPGRIDPHHRRQLAAYFYFLKRDKYPVLDSARLYYVNKNTGEREEFELYFDDAIFNDILDELKTLNYHWDTKILPKKEVSNFCRICQFAPLCRTLLNRKNTKIDHAIIQGSLQGTTK